MGELSKTTVKYAGPDFNQEEDVTGFYLPDVVLETLFTAAKPKTSDIFATYLALSEKLPDINRHRILISEPQVSLQESFDLVIRAFDSFDPRLGVRAREVIEDASRWELNPAEPGEAAGWTLGPDPDNGHPRARIVYSHDGTVSDAVYIAHELGHLMASDFREETGQRYSSQLAETQAFFTQHILYDFLMSRNELPDLKEAAAKHHAGEIIRSLFEWPGLLMSLEAMRGQEPDAKAAFREWLGDDFESYDGSMKAFERRHANPEAVRWNLYQMHGGHNTASVMAGGLFEAAKNKPDSREVIIDALLGGRTDNILGVFEAAGINAEDELKVFAEKAIAAAAKPLMEMAKSERQNKPGSRPFPKNPLI